MQPWAAAFLWGRAQVPCLSDGDARLALADGDAFRVQTKPHGHGDVHSLLHSSGLAAAWAAVGVRWLCFFQDTNGLVFRALPAALGACICNRHPFKAAHCWSSGSGVQQRV